MESNAPGFPTTPLPSPTLPPIWPSNSFPAASINAALSLSVLLLMLVFFGAIGIRVLIITLGQRRVNARAHEAITLARANQSAASLQSGQLGLDASIVGSYPIAVLSTEMLSEPLIKECAVCLAEYEGGDHVKTLPGCGHVFHSDCVDQWLTAKTSCPLCRADLRGVFGQASGNDEHSERNDAVVLVVDERTEGDEEGRGRSSSIHRNVSHIEPLNEGSCSSQVEGSSSGGGDGIKCPSDR